MSRPKHDWHGFAVIQIKKYPDGLQKENSIQSGVWEKAIKSALEETKSMKDGEYILKAVSMRYFDNRYRLEGIADKIGVSENTVRRWTNAFVNRVGKKAGY